VTALDANRDGAIDAAEMANAPATLNSLDANHDGRLTAGELKAGH
jgi:Ca2+-binding EF-hand superfamily protein